MIPTITSAVAEGVEKLTDSFRGRTNVEGIQKALTYSVQILEVAAFDMQNKRQLALASDDSLDQIGALVAEPRNSRSDTEYREAIRVRIRVNRSAGRSLDILEIVRLLTASPLYVEGDVASFSVSAFNQSAAHEVKKILNDARPAGVYGEFISSAWADTNDMRWGSSYDATAGFGGFGSVSGAGVHGSVCVSAQEIGI